MKKDISILAIESSGLVASVALLTGDTLVGEYTINNKLTHSQTLLPMCSQMLDMAGVSLEEIDAIAISEGPGSFTGLRIGSATAKGLALAGEKPILSVPTLQAMAYNFYGEKKYICPMMDARRNQVYTGIYQFVDGKMKAYMEDRACSIENLLEIANGLDREVLFLGDGVPVFAERFQNECKIPYTIAPPHLSRQRASSVAVCGRYLYEEGKVQTAKEHKPVYLRLSQAERERNERLKKD